MARADWDFIGNLEISSPLSKQEQIDIKIYSTIISDKTDMVIVNTQKEKISIIECRNHFIKDVITGKPDVRSIAAALPDVEDIPINISIDEEPEEEYIDEEE